MEIGRHSAISMIFYRREMKCTNAALSLTLNSRIT